LPKEKRLTKNRYRFCQKKVKKKKVLPRNKSLVKKKYSFVQEKKVYPRKDISFAKR